MICVIMKHTRVQLERQPTPTGQEEVPGSPRIGIDGMFSRAVGA